MKQLSFALMAVAFTLAAGPALAAYQIVQWSDGDCKFWDTYGPYPLPSGIGWTYLATDIPTYEAAKAELETFYRQGLCR